MHPADAAWPPDVDIAARDPLLAPAVGLVHWPGARRPAQSWNRARAPPRSAVPPEPTGPGRTLRRPEQTGALRSAARYRGLRPLDRSRPAEAQWTGPVSAPAYHSILPDPLD